MIYTSCFSRYRGKNGISIARTQPTKNGKPYFEELSEFKPPVWLLSGYKDGSITEKEFTGYYNRILNKYNPAIYGEELQGKVLLCWEGPDSFCHRHIIANWLRREGFCVKEWEKSDVV